MTIATGNVTPIVRQAIRSFGKARAAIEAGDVDEMIGQLTRGAEMLEAINQLDRPATRRRPKRKSAS
jgi:hypothetical protein